VSVFTLENAHMNSVVDLDVAIKYPYDVHQVVERILQLRNSGLTDISRRAMFTFRLTGESKVRRKRKCDACSLTQ
jgi:hypothetical protein